MYDNDFEADAYDPADPKHPDWERQVTHHADAIRDDVQPSPAEEMSPLGNILFDLASSEGMLVAARLAGLQYATEADDETVTGPDVDDEG